MEDLKNGTFNVDKYSSKVVNGLPPHLVCMATQLPPDLSQLSLDRWRIIKIDSHTKNFATYSVKETYSKVDDIGAHLEPIPN